MFDFDRSSGRFSRETLRDSYDAIVVGSGPNGLSAALAMAREGLSVLVVEAAPTIGGGTRSDVFAGCVRDICSTVHPAACVSPWFGSLDLGARGVTWIRPPAAVAHPLPDGTAAVLEASFRAMESTLGPDARAWRLFLKPFADRACDLFEEMGPVHVPRRPFFLARFGVSGLHAAEKLALDRFAREPARALFAGCAAHAMQPLDCAGTAAFGIVFSALGHAVGWPFVEGGSQRIADALAALFTASGGEIVTSWRVASIDELPSSRAVLLDLAPATVSRIAAQHLPHDFRHELDGYLHGPGAFKIDWILDGPIPWTAADCARAGMVHVCGTLADVAAAERAVWTKNAPERPFVLVAQPSLFDPTRGPAGKHVVWAYCHVPNGCRADMSARIEAQIERFAPGFRDRILTRCTMDTAALERHDENYVGGDIAGGSNHLAQIFLRPVARAVPYATPNPRLFMCSSSTPPGAGVHGMCGWFAARVVLARAFGKKLPFTPARDEPMPVP